MSVKLGRYWRPRQTAGSFAGRRIPRRQQFLLLLADVERLGTAEIARRMRMPVGVVQRQIAQARRMRSELGRR
jgi:DNA-directed RNA polymerase specialized sigma24 family protein